mgnify:CR=1 FL=1
MDPQEEVRAAQDEVKQLKAQLAALQHLQASPPKLRQGLKIPGLKNTGTTLNYIADGAGIRDDPLNRPRRSPPRRPRRGGPSEEWWNWDVVDAPKPKANLRRGVQATNLLQPQWPQPRVAPAISRDATPPLLPGWKEPAYKSPMAQTEPKLRVGLQIPSLDEARRKPEAHHTVASKKFSVSLPAPSPEESRVHKEFRTTPRFSPDGKQVIMSLSRNGVTDIYTMNLQTRVANRLTNAPSIDTSPTFAPDGRQIVFNSDRGGSQQLYVMDADGQNVRRISFGKGRYATPVWSPRGDLIAFTKIQGGRFHIGVMKPDGSGERLLTSGFLVEAPTWAPNGRVLIYFKQIKRGQGAGATRLYSIDLTGYNERELLTPTDASDPAWSPLIP